MCPLTLKLTCKAARCVGDHVYISNSAGSSDSAEGSSILLNQMVLTGCDPCTQHATLARKRIRWLPNMSHRLPIVKAITLILQTLEWG